MGAAPSPPDARRSRLSIAQGGAWLTLALVLVTACLGALGGLGRIDLTLYDRAISVAERPAEDSILIVAIDDESIDALGRWPWRRGIHAALLDRLHGARAVGLDLIFAERDTRDPVDDQMLANAIRRHGRVVLPVILPQGKPPSAMTMPIPALSTTADGLGYINILLDADGVVRRSTLIQRTHDVRWNHFSVEMLGVGGEEAKTRLLTGGRPADAPVLIPYTGPPGHFNTVSYLSVLRGELPEAAIKNKYVLIGSWSTGLGDGFPTPVSHRSSGMSGVEIIANLLQSVQEGIAYHEARPWANALLSALPVLLLCLAMRRLSPKQAILLSAAMIVATIAASFLLLRWAHVWFPPAAALLGIATSYPFWSWRSQEAALRYMDRELRRLRQEYPPVLSEERHDVTRFDGSLEGRIYELGHALARVRNLRRFLFDGLDGMPDATLVFDHAGHLQFVNRTAVAYFQKLGGHTLQVGQSAYDIFERTIPDASARRVVDLALRGSPPAYASGPWSADVELRDRAGNDLILKCAPIHTAESMFAGTIVTFSDISPIRQAERQREETLRFISHDMRAPQSSILALVELHQNGGDASQRNDSMERIAQLANRTLRLVDDFVHLTRAESMAIEFQTLNLAELLQDAADEFWAPAHTRNIELVVQEPLPAAIVRGNHALLMRALCNLLDNAIKYSPANSRVDCGIQDEGLYWALTVHDQGVGIAAEDKARLFEPFARFGEPLRRNAGGAGLGLAFVHTVATRHSGNASVQSVQGAGSTFVLRLPKADPL